VSTIFIFVLIKILNVFFEYKYRDFSYAINYENLIINNMITLCENANLFTD